MEHNLKISVSKESMDGGIVACRTITLRERILRFLLCEKCRLTTLVPGDTMREIAIKDVGGVCRG